VGMCRDFWLRFQASPPSLFIRESVSDALAEGGPHGSERAGVLSDCPAAG